MSFFFFFKDQIRIFCSIHYLAVNRAMYLNVPIENVPLNGKLLEGRSYTNSAPGSTVESLLSSEGFIFWAKKKMDTATMSFLCGNILSNHPCKILKLRWSKVNCSEKVDQRLSIYFNAVKKFVMGPCIAWYFCRKIPQTQILMQLFHNQSQVVDFYKYYNKMLEAFIVTREVCVGEGDIYN